MMKLGAMVLALGLAAYGQDAKPESKQEPKQDETVTKLSESLEASSKAGGYTFEGRVEQDSGMGGIQMPFSDGNLDGKFKGTVGHDGTVHLKLESSKGIYEMWKRGSRIVQRQTWIGKQPTAGTFAQEVTAILSFPHLIKHAGKMKELRAGAAKDVAGVSCTPIKGNLQSGFVPDEDDDDDAGAGFKVKVFELKKVHATVYVGDDKLVRRVEVTLTKGLSAMVRMGGGIPDEDEEDGEKKDEDEGGMPGMPNFRMSTNYNVTLSGFDAKLEVSVPDDVKKHLGE